MTHIFKIPFSMQGDRVEIPIQKTTDGSLSIAEGYGYDYERNPDKSDPKAKHINRQSFNSILYLITEALGEIQQRGASIWQEASKPYDLGVMVYLENKLWISQKVDNGSKPGANSDWKQIIVDASSLDVYNKEEVNNMFKNIFGTINILEDNFQICNGYKELLQTKKLLNFYELLRIDNFQFHNYKPELLTNNPWQFKNGKIVCSGSISTIGHCLLNTKYPINSIEMRVTVPSNNHHVGFIIGYKPSPTQSKVFSILRKPGGLIEVHNTGTVIKTLKKVTEDTNWNNNSVRLKLTITNTDLTIESSMIGSDTLDPNLKSTVLLSELMVVDGFEEAFYNGNLGLHSGNTGVGITFEILNTNIASTFLEPHSDTMMVDGNITPHNGTLDLKIGNIYHNTYLGNSYYYDMEQGMIPLGINRKVDTEATIYSSTGNITVNNTDKGVDVNVTQPFPTAFQSKDNIFSDAK